MGRERAVHKMEISIKDSGKMICVKEKGFIVGQIKTNIKVIGKIIKEMEKVFYKIIGSYKWKNGNNYEGQWKDDKQTGIGNI